MRLFAKTFNVFLALSLRLRKERRCSIKESVVVKKSKERRKKTGRERPSFFELRALSRFFSVFLFFSLSSSSSVLALSLFSLLSSQKTSQTH